MKDGIIQQVGAPLELYSKPANRFVAGFIGSPAMNFMESTVETKDGGLFHSRYRITHPPHARAVYSREEKNLAAQTGRLRIGLRHIHDRLFLPIAPADQAFTGP